MARWLIYKRWVKSKLEEVERDWREGQRLLKGMALEHELAKSKLVPYSPYVLNRRWNSQALEVPANLVKARNLFGK